MVHWIKNLQWLRSCGGVGLIPCPVQWLKDPALGLHCSSDLVPGPGTSICHRCGHKIKKKKKFLFYKIEIPPPQSFLMEKEYPPICSHVTNFNKDKFYPAQRLPLDQSLADIVYEGPESNYFNLCSPYSLCRTNTEVVG